MRKLLAASPFALVALGSLACSSQCYADDLAQPAVTLSLKQVNASTGRHTYTVQNHLDRPVWLQAQPESGMGYFIQERERKDGRRTGQLSAPRATNLGSRSVKLAAGEALDFVYESGTSPAGFRLGVMYSLTRDGDPWTLVWGSWHDRH